MFVGPSCVEGWNDIVSCLNVFFQAAECMRSMLLMTSHKLCCSKVRFLPIYWTLWDRSAMELFIIAFPSVVIARLNVLLLRWGGAFVKLNTRR
jgi:hypothetical protein